MHEFLYREDLVRVAVIAGIIVSTLIYERLQLTTGGAIVPGYLALFVLAPLSIVVTLGTAYATYRIVNGPIAGRTILFGRRKFELEVLIGLAIVSALYALAQAGIGFPAVVSAVYGIGFVIPGLIAHDMSRQGPRRTTLVLLGAISIVALIVFVLVTLGELAPPQTAPQLGDAETVRGFRIDLLLPAVVASVAAGLVIFRWLGLRSGGFVTAAYIALVLPDPRDLVFTFAIAAVTYVIVSKILAARLLLFGRRKVAMMMLIAAMAGWAAEAGVTAWSGGSYQPWQGFNAIAIMVPGLLANDAERQGPERTMWGVLLAALAVLFTMNLLTAGLDTVGTLGATLALDHP